jgi:hypothetical protein
LTLEIKYPDSKAISTQTKDFLNKQNKKLNELAGSLSLSDQLLNTYIKNTKSITQETINKELQISSGVYPTKNILFASQATSLLLASGDNVKTYIDKCKNSTSNECTEYLPLSYIVKNVLNTDVTSGSSSKIGAGWDQYPFNIAIMNSGTKLISFNDIKKGSSVKCIACIFQAAEVNGSSTSLSKIKVTVNNTGPYETQTAHTQDGKYNWTLFFLPIKNYPIRLNSIDITVSCPGKSVNIVNGQLAIVYN